MGWFAQKQSLNGGNNFAETITIMSRNHSKCLFISSALNEKWETPPPKKRKKIADTAAAFLEILGGSVPERKQS